MNMLEETLSLIDCATDDAVVYGTGFLLVDKEGSIRHVSAEEVYLHANFILNNRT